jgi:hypothetical protein
MTIAISHGIIWRQVSSCLWVAYQQLPTTTWKGPMVGAVALYPDNRWRAIVGRSSEEWAVVGADERSHVAMAMVSSVVRGNEELDDEQ